MTRDCCGACGVQLQPLNTNSSYRIQALSLAAENGLARPGELLLALLAHTLIVHPNRDDVPTLVPFGEGVTR